MPGDGSEDRGEAYPLAMDSNKSGRSLLQQYYSGWFHTPLLWEGELDSIAQYAVQNEYQDTIHLLQDPPTYLGHYAEIFAFHEIERNPSIIQYWENIQINNEERTIGEIDAILKTNNRVLHLEIAYKFYLFDPEHGSNELEHWIGPNRRDSFVKKLNKIRQHQFPIIKTPEAEAKLNSLGIPTPDVQSVNFKGQLYLPNNCTSTPEILNSACIQGVYFHRDELSSLKDCRFYIPKKIGWFIEPYPHVDWIGYELFLSVVNDSIKAMKSSLFWYKMKNGELRKAFAVWW